MKLNEDDIETYKYLFDLQGYIIVENVLNSKDVSTIQSILDKRLPVSHGLEFADGEFGFSGATNSKEPGLLEYGPPIKNLIDNPTILSILRPILGDGFRIDHMYGIQMIKGTKSLELHGGSINADITEQYHVQNQQINSGLTVVSWNLVDTGPDQGGFLCIPGSHKQNFDTPKKVFSMHDKADCVLVPKVKPGSAIIFTEALAHGTASWKSDSPRRSILFKYTPSYMAFTRKYAEIPKDTNLTQRQKDLFNLPSDSNSFGRPSLFD